MLRIFLTLAVLLASTCVHATAPTVLFDQGHGQKFVIEKKGELHLSGLADAFRAAGYEVRASTGPLTPAALEGVAAVVSSGAFSPFAKDEIDALWNFVKKGGRLALMLHIPHPYVPVLTPVGVQTSLGVLRETQNVEGADSLNFRVLALSEHPVFAGLTGFNAYGSWALRGVVPEAVPLAKTSPQAWMDLDGNKLRDPAKEPLDAFAVAVALPQGKGDCIVFADDAIFQDRFLTGDNLRLANQLAGWLRR